MVSNFFSTKSKLNLGKALLTKNQPIYVQFYVTARCNLACEQCNVIYSNADLPECSHYEIEKIAENLAKIGVCVVLLTGGEPFARRDLPKIVKAFISRGIHVRLQTNGLASREALEECVKAGANDISVSLDSLSPESQDAINGDFNGSWFRAIKTISTINEIFPKDAFAAMGCVLAPKNIDSVPSVIEFATEIGWWLSLVPAHVTDQSRPMSFRTYDKVVEFSPDEYPKVEHILKRVIEMKRKGHHVYDSLPYLSDILRVIKKEPLTWRNRAQGVCDSPNLYFAILPDGQMAVCCDWRMKSLIKTQDERFPLVYRSNTVYQEAKSIAKACSGCMYGSFPEITVSSRYLSPIIERAFLFAKPSESRELKKFTADEMKSIADRIRVEKLSNAA